MAKDTRNIGQVADDAIRRGLRNHEVLDEVKRLHPNGNTKMASIAWYRNQLRSNGEDVPTETELKNAARQAGLEPSTSPPDGSAEPKSTKELLIEKTMRELILDGSTNEQVHDTTMRAYPEARLKHRDAEDLRTAMIRAGENVPTDDEARRSQGGPPWSPDATSEDQLDRREEALGLLSKVENLLRK